MLNLLSLTSYFKDNPALLWSLVALGVCAVLIIIVILVLNVGKKSKKNTDDCVSNDSADEEIPVKDDVTTRENVQIVSSQEEIIQVDEYKSDENENDVPDEKITQAQTVPQEKTAETAETVTQGKEEKTEEIKSVRREKSSSARYADVEIPTEKTAYGGKWLITKDEDGFSFSLRASNGELLFHSNYYTSLIGAKNGIKTYKINILNERFKIKRTKQGQFIFVLFNANNQVLCTGESYANETRCRNAILSVKRFANTAVIEVDESAMQ